MSVHLDPTVRCPDSVEFEANLRRKIIGQEEAIRAVTSVLQTFNAGLNAPGRPIANLLFLGPTGTGKTRVVEATTELLLGDVHKLIKVDCAEYQEAHAISKLIGSPPGYIGHRETKPAINQERIEKSYTEQMKLAIILFDEIEKANPAMWDLLLGILDKAALHLGSGEDVDLSSCIIFMTSNVGSKEMNALAAGGFGFSAAEKTLSTLDKESDILSQQAARRKFPAEFFNRLDHAITFRHLTREQLLQILHIELGRVQQRILTSPSDNKFVFICTKEAEDYLIGQGHDQRYGARHLKRAVERYVVNPLGNLLTTGQISLGDLVRVSLAGDHLEFDKIPADQIAQLPEAEWADFKLARE